MYKSSNDNWVYQLFFEQSGRGEVKVMSRLGRRKSRIGTIIYNHIINNKREYLTVTILFFMGLIISIIFFNNSNEITLNEISTYLNNLFNNIKNNENIDLGKILKESLIYNLTITLLLWFGASTIIGIPIVYSSIVLKGFSMGYTISSLLFIYGLSNGLLFSICFLLLHNIIFVPTMFAISVSGVKLYKSIMKNKQRENIKLEILRHTIFCFVMLLGMVMSAVVETYLSTNISVILLKNINF